MSHLQHSVAITLSRISGYQLNLVYE